MQSTDSAIPILPAISMEATMAFYRRLGFTCEVVSPNDDYVVAWRDSLEIHFFLYKDLVPQESSFGVYFRVQDVDALYQEFGSLGLPSLGIPRMTLIENKPWGMREFAVIDENGTLIRIGKSL